MRSIVILIHVTNKNHPPTIEFDPKNSRVHIKVHTEEEASILFLLMHGFLRRYPAFEPL